MERFIRGGLSGRMEPISFAVGCRGEWSEFHSRWVVGANRANFIRGGLSGRIERISFAVGCRGE